MELPELVSHDRDYKMLEARKNGANYREIGRLFNVAPSTAHAGVRRALRGEGRKYMDEMESVGWLFAERYDTLLRDLMPFTKAQKVQDPDSGKEIRIPPSYEAVDRVLKVMAEMKKMFGMDKEGISFDGPTQTMGLESTENKGETSPEEYATKVLAELIKVGAIGGSDADRLSELMGQVVDAEVIEDSEDIPRDQGLALARVPSLMEPKERVDAPAWVDDDEEEYEPGEWIPDRMGDATEFDGI